ncbi:hypothetical protein KR018_005593 [Drosophila ironensis]|nr:hypothetical protein KR018_005593 [Drosophila ironensis]
MIIIKLNIVFSTFAITSAQYLFDLFKCNDVLLKCQETELNLGKYNKTTDDYNRNCPKEIGSKWSNITRCELEAATCLLNMLNQMKVNCDNIADIMHL